MNQTEPTKVEVTGGCIVQPQSQLFIVSPPVIEIDYTPEEREKTFREIWDNLSQKDVSEFVEQKQGLNYLPWSDCIDILRGEYPDVQCHTYWFPLEGRWLRTLQEVKGYSVQTSITINGINKSISLPIWSGRPPKAIEMPDSMDINTAIMRCTVKSAAFGFGLGLYIYRGEDLPVDVTPGKDLPVERKLETKAEQPKQETMLSEVNPITTEQKNQILVLQKQLDFDDEGLAIGVNKAIGDSVAVADLTTAQADVVIAKMKDGVERRK